MNLGDRVRGLVSDATTSNTSSSTQRRSIMSRLGKQGSGSSSSSPSITVSVANRLGPRTVTASTGGGSGGLGGRSVAAGSAGLTRTVTNDAAVTNLSIRGAAASATIQISNLHPEASAADIETCFAEMGAVQRCVLHTDASGKSKGIAEVTYENRASALEAIAKFHGKVADGRALQVVELTSGSATIAGAASKIAKKSLAAITAASKTMYADHVEASGARVSKVELQPTPVASAASGQPVAARLGPMLGGGGGGSGSGGRKRGGGGGARVERVSRNTSFTVTV
ncbi:hypothetical protein HK102_002973 [Quaeritorhiza haematococci]|nr:hypothetical protein HK102_002973 [Quaeritorhiza haematococci]